MATIAVIGTLDSKGHEHAFVAEEIRRSGHETLLVDVGTLGAPQVEPDRTRDEILKAAGVEFPEAEDRGERVGVMAEALPVYLKQLAETGEIDGVISLGGGGGTAIATAGMRALPIGFPKLMVSTLASGNTAHYVGTKDIVMFPSIVDVAGLNQISRMIFARAAGAICGMTEKEVGGASDKPLIVASMFGNTTECVDAARKIFEDKGYEVLVFHSTGTGGRTMESLIESGMVAGVFDVTTTEWADELVGATLSAGPERLDATGKAGLPAIVSPGCLDMANFGEKDSVPSKYDGRNFYIHNPQVTL
ncbi:Tm-1-like ATP-binding domain-containing protein, partial [Akkermansiaceae bacterium]|nr:Tm-1-like ATP-binding domain-containing protein [Akkermansiaceae bacterium]